jgi:hypothetical protein
MWWLQQWEVGKPGSYCVGVLPAHHSRDLAEMVEVMGHPGGKKLSERNDTELRMAARALEIGLTDVQRFKAAQVLSA